MSNERHHDPYSPSRLPYLARCPGWIGDGDSSEAAERGTDIGARLASYVLDGVDPLDGAPEDGSEAIENGVQGLDRIRSTWPDVTWSAEDFIRHASLTDAGGYPDLLGTDALLGDCVLVELKTGRGDREPAERNLQVMSLALALLEAGWTAVNAYLIECDRGSVSEAVFTDAAALRQPIARLIERVQRCTEEDLSAGSHCAYCVRREQCPRTAESPDKALAVLGERSLSPDDYARALSPEVLGETLTRVAPLVAIADSYVAALKARAMRVIESGGEVPGWTTKDGRGVRSWAGEEIDILDALAEAYPDTWRECLTLASPAQAEKKLGRDAKPLVARLTKTTRGRTLVRINEDSA